MSDMEVKMLLRHVGRQASQTSSAVFPSGNARRGEAEAPPPCLKVCTFVCMLASTNPCMGRKSYSGIVYNSLILPRKL